MSAIVGEGTEIRIRVAKTRTTIADLTAQLAATPAWLKVGEPDRFAAAGDRDAAHTAAALADELDNQTFELTRSQQLLDQILSPVPAQPPPTQQQYGVLLPVRLETRFVPPTDGAAPGTEQARWRLRVRVEPDPVSLPAGGRAPTRQEAAQVAALWTACDGDLSAPEGERAFRTLAGQVGGARAAYLLRAVAVDRGDAGFIVVDDAARTPAPAVLGLPSRLEIWGDGVHLDTLEPQRDKILATFDLEAIRPGPDGTIPRTWWNSFEVAEEVGLARTLHLDETRPFFGSLVCIGLNHTDEGPAPREVIEAHIAAGSLGTLAPLTPTNTVDGQPTADLGRDPVPWLDVARQPLGDAGGLTALTGGQLLEGVPSPDLTPHDVANTLVRALWPVLWQRTLKDIGDLGEEVYRLGEYADRHLHPFGPYPVLRVGDLPYGVLPVSSYGDWVPASDDPPFEGVQVRASLEHADVLTAAAGDDLTVRDADAERLLRVLAQTPTARAYGSRNLPPTVFWAAFQALIEGVDPGEVVAGWDARASLLLGQLGHAARRRYSPMLFVEPWPDEVNSDHPSVLEAYLASSWLDLAESNDLSSRWRMDRDGPPPNALTRLVRQSLLLTNIEVCRLFTDQVPGPRPTSYLVPLDDPQQMFRDATDLEFDGPVRELPPQAVALVDGTAPNLARNDAVVRQFEDVREAVVRLAGTEPALADPVLTGVLDAAGHRADVWLTAAASRRMRQLTTLGAQPLLGAYGWVDALTPSDDATPPTRAGLVHAPSYSQALTAAVLRDHVVHDEGDTRWQMTLSSMTVRSAAALADQVRSGIPLGEVLGREIERRFPDPDQVLELREAFEARPEWAGRRVCDGQKVLEATSDLPAWLPHADLDDLRAALEAYADLLVTDAVHDVVAGRPDAAAEALEAAAGLGAPPELRLLRTPREGGTVRTEVAFVIRYDAAWEATGTHPAEVADPAFTRFLRAELGAPKGLTWATDRGTISLRDLGLKVVDLLVVPASDVTAMVRDRIGAGATGTGAAALRSVARLASMLGQPYSANPGAADVLRARLGRMRASAGALHAALTTDLTAAAPRELREWGLGADPADAAVTLERRLERVGPAATDAGLGGEALAERIRILLPTPYTLPLVCPEDVPTTVAGEGWLDDWLPVTAAVRPALAKVESALLQTSRTWRAAASDPRPWQAPVPTEDGISGDRATHVVIGPGVGRAKGRGVVRLDSWGETVPAPRHTTWTAFGYDAPRARAPQAVLIVVPRQLGGAGLQVDEARRAVLTARDLARARSVSSTPDELSAAMPTSVVEATGSTGCTLSREAL